MGAAAETRELGACLSEALPWRDGRSLCPESCLCLESYPLSIPPTLGPSMFLFTNVSREDGVLEGALKEQGSGNVRSSPDSVTDMPSALGGSPALWSQNLSQIHTMVRASTFQFLLGLALEGFGPTGSVFPLLAKENVYCATGPHLCRLIASSGGLSLYWMPSSDHLVTLTSNKNKAGPQIGETLVRKRNHCNRKNAPLSEICKPLKITW